MNIKKYYNNNWLKYSILALFLLLAFTFLLSIRYSVSRSFQVVFGSIYLLFLPGFVWSWVFWKKQDEIDFIERIIISLVLSITIVPLAVFILNKFGIRINTFNSGIEILGIILFGIIVKYSSTKLQQKKRFAKL
ncbi:MAG: DUF1616 domain-containing protein [Patescibacteria group bacterium]